MKLTTEQAQELLDKWQPILRLRDWDIEIFSKPRKRIEDKCDGTNYVHTDLKEAEINVVESKPSSGDHETLVVHELLHCHTDPVDNDVTEKAVDVVVEQISKAFVQLDRKWSKKYEKLLAEYRALEARFPRDDKEKEKRDANSPAG